jgi:GAF domain-containing protein
MKETTLEEYKQLVEEQGQALLDVVRSVALGDLDVEVGVPEGIQVLSDLATGLEMMIDDLRETMVEQRRARAEVEKARQQAEVALEEAQAIQRRYLRQEWEGYTTAAQASRGYLLSESAEGPTMDVWLPVMTAAVQQADTMVERDEEEGLTLAVPIRLHGEIIGVLGFSRSGSGYRQEAETWSDGEIAAVEAVVEGMALALENQRLLDEEQQASLLLSERVKELDCLNDIGRKIDETPSIPELLTWMAGRIPQATQYPDLCVAAVEFENQIYGSAEASNMPFQIVQTLYVDDEPAGRIYVSYIQDQDFLDEESALLGDVARRVSGHIEQQRLAAALDSERSTLEAIVHNIPLGVFVAEAPTGRPLLANELAQKMLGRGISPDADVESLAQIYEAYRYGTDELYPTNEMPLVQGMFCQTTTISDMEVRRPDGTRMLLEISGAPIRDTSGEIVGSVATFQDITARRQARTERERLLMNMQSRLLQLQTAAEVSRAATSILDIDELLNTSVNLIRDRFGYYYVGLFLVDENKTSEAGAAADFAVLRAGTGEAGRAMLEEGHKLEIGGESMIGRCVASGQARIALDVGEEAMHFRNPHLPLTRSEMAQPLISRGQILGALTVQSTEEAAFSEEDVVVLQTLADQIANALINARQFELVERARTETDKRGREINTLNDIGHKMAELPPVEELLDWMTTRIPLAMQYPSDCVVAIEHQGQVYGASEAMNLAQQVVQSLRVGGSVAGRIHVAYTQEHSFLNEESALLGDIVRRVGGYIENQQLLRETETRARHEQILRHITARVRGSTDPAAIMRTTVRELGIALDRPTFVRLGSAEQLRIQNSEFRILNSEGGE